MKNSLNGVTKILGKPITPRNQSQQALGVAQKELDDKLKELNVPTFKGLEEELKNIRTLVSSLQNELQKIQEMNREIDMLHIMVRDAFRAFIQRVIQISEGGIEILRMVEPSIPEHLTTAERTALVDLLLRNGSIDTFAQSLTRDIITAMQIQINHTQSRDFAESFREVVEPWNRLSEKIRIL